MRLLITGWCGVHRLALRQAAARRRRRRRRARQVHLRGKSGEPARRHRLPPGRHRRRERTSASSARSMRSSTSPPRPTWTARSSGRRTSCGPTSSGRSSCSRSREEAGARFVQVSTDEVYGDVEAGWSSREDDPLRPSSPYSAAKAGGDLQVLAAVRTFGVNASITRGSNTYGPNQYPEKVLPLFTTNALDGEPLPLYGDGSQVRDWLHVDDHCAASSSSSAKDKPARSTTSARTRSTRTSS